MTIMGCAHPQYGTFAQKKRFSDSTVGTPDTEHDLKTNDTALFAKGQLISKRS